ncbi:16S rRNA (cytosine(967)-C(5))-methyltransferase RsmB [Neobittarella massiliensis]|uniref:16S rRNA (cytosine(967)-C(5))-methyltransferase RsmB n=1 Tax=Neobittarella massiliensis (ex Bilen et al. 2018) TaxID=2041842 RepID=UPI0013EA7D07|nr:16S rRNA (cytosine(967)-C(5))-methyltransferase RsmB [Neobittarella massiliensis]
MAAGQQNPRLVAVQVLTRCEDGGYVDAALDAALQKSGLPAKERALCTRMVYGVTAARRRLDAQLAGYCAGKKLTPPICNTLRLGLYQLQSMDGVPDAAAVNETVRLPALLRQKSATGLVNAVLRRYLRDGKPTYSGSDLSVRYSVEPWIAKMWCKAYGEEQTRQLLARFEGEFPTFIRVNTLRTTAPDLIRRLSDEGLTAEPTALPNCLLLRRTGYLPELPSFAEGLFHVQDLSSQYCCQALGAQPGDTVLDCCAAPGGKSFTVAQYMGGQGRLCSFDIWAQKLPKIEDGARRLGITNLTAACHDATTPYTGVPLADKILCDVPCSGLGILGKKPDLRYKQRGEIKDLPDLQLRILKQAAEQLRPGGVLVYSTCTLSPNENQGVVGKFLRDCPDFTAVDLTGLCPGAAVTDGMATLLPHQTGSDGFFIAKLKRGTPCNR